MSWKALLLIMIVIVVILIIINCKTELVTGDTLKRKPYHALDKWLFSNILLLLLHAALSFVITLFACRLCLSRQKS